MTRAWFSAADLAALALPGLSGAKRKINERAEAERWALRADADGMPLARPRSGRGGGLEFHISLLPASARLDLVKRGLVEPEGRALAKVTTLPATSAGQLWAWYDRQPSKIKAEAESRAAAIDAIERLEMAGLTRSASVETIAEQVGKSSATLWNWLALVANCAGHDRLPNLAPRRQGGGTEAVIDDYLWTLFKSDWLRPEGPPTFAACYDRLKPIADQRGLSLPNVKTLQRKMVREVDGRIIVMMRMGPEALRRMIPQQERSVSKLQALTIVNIDGHRWDVMVRFPDGEVKRPMMIGIQDVYSRKMLAWRIGKEECVSLTRLAFADMFRNHGIPEKCLLDNSRTFASKWFTGGATTRFRFKIKHDEPLGLLIQLGIQNMWATPYHGQAKPIERAWGTLAEVVAQHPAFAGAYVGKDTVSKPHNYGARAVDLDVFEKVVADGIAAHNAKPGRRTEMGRGLYSFDQVFEQSIAAGAIIRRATEEQIGVALLAGDQVTAHRLDGSIKLFGNRYWCAGMSAFANQKLTIRFDPANLHSEIRAYAHDGAFIAVVPILEAAGFADQDAARERAKQVSEHRKATRRLIELEGLMTAAQVAAAIPDYDDEGTLKPQPSVIRPVRMRGNAAVKLAPEPQHQAGNSIDFMDRFAAGERALRIVRNEPD